MMNDKSLSLLGLMKKAGAIEFTELNCQKAIKERKAKLLLIASDASETGCEKILNLCESYKIKAIHTQYSNFEFSSAIGRSSCAYIAITDSGFADSFLRLGLK